MTVHFIRDFIAILMLLAVISFIHTKFFASPAEPTPRPRPRAARCLPSMTFDECRAAFFASAEQRR